MYDFKCPNCGMTITVSNKFKEHICPNCLANHGEAYIMVESKNNENPKNLGGGFFEIPKEK